MSKSKCVGDSRGADTSMRNNMRQHAKSYNKSPSQDKILNSNFLFSLTPQKHSVGETMAATARTFSFKVQNVINLHGPQVDKAWQALSSLNLSSRSYIKPGKSLPVSMDGNIDFFKMLQELLKCSSDAKNSSTGSTWADQNFGDINHKFREPVRMTVPVATISVSGAGRAESTKSGNYGFVSISLKCVRSQGQFLPSANNFEVVTPTSLKGMALPGLSSCGDGFMPRKIFSLM